MTAFLAACQFLTRLPLARFQSSATDRVRAAYWFGLAGLLVGGLLVAVEYLLRTALPLAPRLVVVLAVNAVLTGALHLDGLADTCDALGARERSRALAIMRDSRIGAYGVLGLMAVLAFQFTVMAQLAPARLPWALLFAPAWGRAAMVVAAAAAPAARPDGRGADFITSLRPGAALASLATVALAAVLLRNFSGGCAGVVALLVAGAAALYFRRRFGGNTGDTLGCVNQLTEAAVFCLFLVRS